jgi:hypothetical protein
MNRGNSGRTMHKDDVDEMDEDESGSGTVEGVVCCGTAHASKFCPSCGKQLISTHPLDGLLTYLRAQASHHNTRAANCQDPEKTHFKNPSERNRALVTAKANAKKWVNWGDTLGAAMRDHEKLLKDHEALLEKYEVLSKAYEEFRPEHERSFSEQG